MPTTVRRVLASLALLLLTVALVVQPAGASPVDEAQAQLDAAKQDRQQAAAELAQAQEALGGIGAEVDVQAARVEQVSAELQAAADELADLENELALANQAVDDAEAELDTIRGRLQSRKRQLQSAQRKLATELESFSTQVTSAYKVGDTREALLIESALDGDSLDEVVTNLQYVKTVLDAEQATYRRVLDARDAAASAARDVQWSELNQQAATRLARIAADHVRDLTVAQRDATARLEQARADQEEILEQLEGEQRQAAAQLGQLQSNLDDAERQVAIATDRLEAAKRAEEIGSTPVDGVASGSLCPVPTGRFINDWGFPRGGGTRSHEGTDVFADEGDPIYSPVTGTVDWVSSGGGLSGLGIAIMGDNGWRWVFVHNSANHVVEGQRVTVGQHIGDIGRTGNAATTPPHAHTELRPGPYGTPKTNPYPHLVQLCR